MLSLWGFFLTFPFLFFFFFPDHGKPKVWAGYRSQGYGWDGCGTNRHSHRHYSDRWQKWPCTRIHQEGGKNRPSVLYKTVQATVISLFLNIKMFLEERRHVQNVFSSAWQTFLELLFSLFRVNKRVRISSKPKCHHEVKKPLNCCLEIG